MVWASPHTKIRRPPISLQQIMGFSSSSFPLLMRRQRSGRGDFLKCRIKGKRSHLFFLFWRGGGTILGKALLVGKYLVGRAQTSRFFDIYRMNLSEGSNAGHIQLPSQSWLRPRKRQKTFICLLYNPPPFLIVSPPPSRKKKLHTAEGDIFGVLNTKKQHSSNSQFVKKNWFQFLNNI